MLAGRKVTIDPGSLGKEETVVSVVGQHEDIWGTVQYRVLSQWKVKPGVVSSRQAKRLVKFIEILRRGITLNKKEMK